MKPTSQRREELQQNHPWLTRDSNPDPTAPHVFEAGPAKQPLNPKVFRVVGGCGRKNGVPVRPLGCSPSKLAWYRAKSHGG
ncbi:hypothetical protein TNCV_683891 [Trichonephila clavipes]|nr:hypothetical protein TNCV_683891 [Trichonephila clavipes]